MPRPRRRRPRRWACQLLQLNKVGPQGRACTAVELAVPSRGPRRVLEECMATFFAAPRQGLLWMVAVEEGAASVRSLGLVPYDLADARTRRDYAKFSSGKPVEVALGQTYSSTASRRLSITHDQPVSRAGRQRRTLSSGLDAEFRRSTLDVRPRLGTPRAGTAPVDRGT